MKFMEVVPPGTNIDFIGKWKICVCISSAIILISLVAALPQVRGIKLGLDFAGGVEMVVRFPEGVKADEGLIRAAVTSVGAKDPGVWLGSPPFEMSASSSPGTHFVVSVKLQVNVS